MSSLSRMPTVHLLLSSATKTPVVELTTTVGTVLRELGCAADVLYDELPAEDSDDPIVVVGPHDVYPHLVAPDPDAVSRSLARTTLICCDRPFTAEWRASLRQAVSARAVLHVSELGSIALRRHGIPALNFQLGYHESLDAGAGPGTERPLDVVCLAALTPRREQVLAEAAPVLAAHDVDLRLVGSPSTPARPALGSVWGDAKRQLLAAAKVSLNVHPDDDFAFEWLRALDALCNRSVLVSEESVGFSPLVPGRHFVSGTATSLPLLLDHVLRDPDQLEAIREEAYAFVREELPLRRSVEGMLEVATTPVEPRPPRRLPRLPRLEDLDARADGQDGTNGDVSSSSSASDEVLQLIAKQNAVLKKLFFDLRAARREVAKVSRLVDDPSAPLVETTTNGMDRGVTPDVTVVVTVHNYARYVRSALASVIASHGVDLEVIVVDDASTDDSVSVVRAVIAEHPEVPMMLLAQRLNTGVQRARNLALSHARAPYAFILDADNVIYPYALRKLWSRLRDDPGAGFAYGIIERFMEGRGVGLMGTHPWDRSHLAREHYIDAMALIRVDAWRQVGGYVSDPSMELGWEDYDLWLSFATQGLYGVHVREIVGRYRVHGVSALTMTTLDTANLMGRFRDRHAAFFNSIPGEDE